MSPPFQIEFYHLSVLSIFLELGDQSDEFIRCVSMSIYGGHNHDLFPLRIQIYDVIKPSWFYPIVLAEWIYLSFIQTPPKPKLNEGLAAE